MDSLALDNMLGFSRLNKGRDFRKTECKGKGLKGGVAIESAV